MNSSATRFANAAVWSWATSVALVAACSPTAEQHAALPTPSLEAATTSNGEISLRLTDAAGLEQALDAEHGKVVLVDFWATWCGPCVEQFPHTVQLANELQSQGLAVIAVSMDNPGAEAQVREFLEQQDARFTNLLSSYRSPIEATKAFGLPGPVPCYRLYDRQGRLTREFGIDPQAKRQFTAADIDAAIREHL